MIIFAKVRTKVIKYVTYTTIFLLVSLGVLISPSIAFAATYYVSTDGNDTYPGTINQPWRTIQKAANTLLAGDAVLVDEGTYPETVTIFRPGTDNAMITYQAQGAVNVNSFDLYTNWIKIQGFNLTSSDFSWNGAITIDGSDNIIKDNYVHDLNRIGITTSNTSSRNTIEGNYVVRAKQSGMIIRGTYNKIVDNDISDITDYPIQGMYDANGFYFHGTGHIFRGNYIHNFLLEHQAGKPHIDAFQTFDNSPYDPTGQNILFEKNMIFMGNDATGQLSANWDNNPGPHCWMLGGSSKLKHDNITIRNNICEAFSGINQGEGGSNGSNVYIYNNTFIGNIAFTNQWPSGIQLHGVTNYVIKNNILVDYSYSHLTIDNSTYNSGNNLFWNSNGKKVTFENYSPNQYDIVNIDPSFISLNYNDPSNRSLKSNSSAINNGVSISSVTDDFINTPRPQDDRYDMGTYEFKGTTLTPIPTTIIPTQTPEPTITEANSPTPPQSIKNPDVNGDGFVNDLDFSQVLRVWGPIASTEPEDLDSNGKVNTLDLSYIIASWTSASSTPEASPTPTFYIDKPTEWFEAESGSILNPFLITTTFPRSIYQKESYDYPSQGGEAIYTLNIAEAASYLISTKVNAADTGTNSFFVNFDAEPDTSMVWHILLTSGFEERYVSWDGNVEGGNPPHLFNLSSGNHSLIIRGREGYTYLDSIKLVKVIPADINKDGIVNTLDFSLFLSAWQMTGTNGEDINGDGIVNSLDGVNILAGWTM